MFYRYDKENRIAVPCDPSDIRNDSIDDRRLAREVHYDPKTRQAYIVSTVFVPIDQDYYSGIFEPQPEGYIPSCFETMVFLVKDMTDKQRRLLAGKHDTRSDESSIDWVGICESHIEWSGIYSENYKTYDEAIAGHERIVDALKNGEIK